MHHHGNPIQRAVGIEGGIIDLLKKRAVTGTPAKVDLDLTGIGGAWLGALLRPIEEFRGPVGIPVGEELTFELDSAVGMLPGLFR